MPTDEELRQVLADAFEERKTHDPAFSLAEYGAFLAQRAHRPEPYIKQFIGPVLKGAKKLTGELRQVALELAQEQDGASELAARMTTFTAHGLRRFTDGVFIDGEEVRCRNWPACPVVFVKTNYFQRYCPLCREKRATERRR